VIVLSHQTLVKITRLQFPLSQLEWLMDNYGASLSGGKNYKITFDDPKKETMFILKYSQYL